MALIGLIPSGWGYYQLAEHLLKDFGERILQTKKLASQKTILDFKLDFQIGAAT